MARLRATSAKPALAAEQAPVISVARAPRGLVLLAWLVLGSALVLGLVSLLPDVAAPLGGLALFIAGGAFVIALIALYGLHLLTVLRLPFALAKDSVDLEKTRRRQREYAMSLVGSGPSPVRAPHSTKALAWGIASLVVPLVAPVALIYGWDSLRFVRMSGGNLAGGRQAWAGLVLALVGMIEFAILLALISTVRTD
jgi:hypothetical protein